MANDSQPTLGQETLRVIRAEAAQIAQAVSKAAESSRGNEAQLAMQCDLIFAYFARQASLHWEPLGERRVVWQEDDGKRRGRIDRLFNRVVVEYKKPGTLHTTNNAKPNRSALTQIKDYMDGLKTEEGWKSPSMAGVITDGFRFIFCRYSAGQWVEEAPAETSAPTVARFLRLLLTFHRPPLLPDPLVEKFGATSQITFETVRAFYDALTAPTHKLTNALYSQWEDFFSDISGLDPARLKTKRDLMKFAHQVTNRPEVDPAKLLFALYSYSALLIKLLVVAAVAPFFDSDNPDRLSDWAMLEDEELRTRLKEVERGTFFEKIVRNFTEGDFFGWYCDEWTPAVAKQVRQLLNGLSEFDPDSVEQAPERVRDLLKRLYHGLLPRQVRHDLGEYYTPDWLAERLLSQLDNDVFGPKDIDVRRQLASHVRSRLTTTRFIDPSCGSGTFIVLIIRTLRRWARECGIAEADKLLPALLQNVVGFDLNPLAVISSRANFLLSVADLLRTIEEPIELPIYLADSIVLPAEGQGEALFTRGVYELPLRGVGKQFLVPEVLANPEHLNILARVLRQDVEHDVGPSAFLQRCQSELRLSASIWERCELHLRILYETIAELHRDGRNGLWADIARNMFMPLFVEQADFVVGNPPWVNFESLPQHYRDRSKVLWEKYGLFVHGGMDTILGKGKKDVSTLLTYVAADLYLKPHGKLGFVITQSVFKTSGAAQGFRRFVIPASSNGKKKDAVPLCILQVDDFSSMQPFEGATNRTAAFVMQKGRPNRYPVQYNVWNKATKKNVPFQSSLKEALPLLRHRQLGAEPVDGLDITSAWITTQKKALTALRKLLGKSDYRAYAGAYSGGANAVYWLELLQHNTDGTVKVRNISEGAKREIQAGTHEIEPDLLYPLLRGREVGKWRTQPDHDARFLMVQDNQKRRGIPESEMKKHWPRTLGYLEKYEPTLRVRAAFKRYFRSSDAFYSMFNVAEYTFSRFKLVWAEQGDFGCAVVGMSGDKPFVPDHKIMMIPFDDESEAHYVCALANSSPFRLAVGAYSINIQQDPHVFQNVRIPSYLATNAAHKRLAQLSEQAHKAAVEGELGELPKIEKEIDRQAAEVWGLTEQELKQIQETLKELEE
jgi:hypothetical protein